MKRYGNIWNKIISPENIFLAYKKSREGKGWQRTIKKVEENLEEKLSSLRDTLINKTFKPAKYVEMEIYEPKKRIIYKLPYYPDRIIHHALMRIISPIWDKMFIKDSYACRPGKGQHIAVQRAMQFALRNKYILQCDISKFYPSVDHDILMNIIRQKIKDVNVLELIEKIVRSFPGNKNVPIGNYTSGWFGNLYLNELDKFIKQKLFIKDYIRFSDDFLIFLNNKHELKNKLNLIKNFINDALKLKFSKSNIFSTSLGIDFLGYRIFPNNKHGYILLRKRTVKRTKIRLKTIPWKLKHNLMTKDQVISSLASTYGVLKWCNSYNLRKKLNIEKIKNEFKL